VNLCAVNGLKMKPGHHHSVSPLLRLNGNKNGWFQTGVPAYRRNP
jgi:hypothetical protein